MIESPRGLDGEHCCGSLTQLRPLTKELFNHTPRSSGIDVEISSLKLTAMISLIETTRQHTLHFLGSEAFFFGTSN
jgi:hypothetical protein